MLCQKAAKRMISFHLVFQRERRREILPENSSSNLQPPAGMNFHNINCFSERLPVYVFLTALENERFIGQIFSLPVPGSFVGELPQSTGGRANRCLVRPQINSGA